MPEFGYKKIFENRNGHRWETDDLNLLATVMSKKLDFDNTPIYERIVRTLRNIKISVNSMTGLDIFDVSDPTADRPEPEQIPAGYTYLAQFIAHDISWADKSERHIEEDLPFGDPVTPDFIRKLKNKRNSMFDLEAIYGHVEPTNNCEKSREKLIKDHPLPLLKLGMTMGDYLPGANIPYPCDLTRKNGSPDIDIVDPRNDENLILAQTQVAFTKFHNALVVHLKDAYKIEEGENEEDLYNRTALFNKARELAIRYYQTMILTDFLPRIILESTLNDVLEKVRTDPESLFYKPADADVFIPLEFSLAAYRFGHSMIRGGYNFNKLQKFNGLNETTATLDMMMRLTGRGRMGDAAGDRVCLQSSWIINWKFFYQIEDATIPNFAEPIDTSLPLPLLKLRPGVLNRRANSIAALDLFRGQSFGILPGQDMARSLEIPEEKILTAGEMGDLINSKEIDSSTLPGALTPDQARVKLREAFSEKTPLWFYILAEAELQAMNTTEIKDTGKLGEVGSRIIAEVFIQLLYRSEISILKNEKWEGSDGWLLENGTFSMSKMLRFIQETGARNVQLLYGNNQVFDELNPLG